MSVGFGAAVAQDAGPRLFAPGVVSTGHDDSHLSFTPDGNSIYFLRNKPDFMHWTILTAQRAGNSWRRPRVAPFSGRYSDADVFVTLGRTTSFRTLCGQDAHMFMRLRSRMTDEAWIAMSDTLDDGQFFERFVAATSAG